MKFIPFRWRSCFVSLGAVPLAIAQTPISIDRATAPADETISLSPFVVQTSKDVGYHASSTLAGTRLNTLLGDIGAPVSVVTKEFLQDTGVTDINELFLYTVSTEGSGIAGNYSATSGSGGVPLQDDSRRRPQSATRVRGLVPADLTRDYFLTDIPLESYNVDRVDISRGPNAILFGLGSPSGVANSSLVKASYQDTSFGVQLRYGSHGSYRAVSDLNHVLIPRKLAFRFVSLNKETHWVQHPTFERDNRLFATVKANPFADTTLTVSLEHGNIKARRPLTIAPTERISAWFLAGKPRWDSSLPATAQVNPVFPPVGSAPDPLYNVSTTVFTNPNLFWQFVIPREANGPAQTGFQGKRPPTATNPNTGFSPPDLNFMGPQDEAAFSLTLNRHGLPPSVFNFRDQLFSGESGHGTHDFRAINASLEQHLFDRRIGLEVAFDRSNYGEFYREPFGIARTNSIMLDVNTKLPDGRANPNFSRPFIISWESGARSEDIERESVRGTAYGVFDSSRYFSGGLGRWLGRHTLTAFASTQNVSSFNRVTKMGWVGGNIAYDVNESSIVQQRRNVVDLYYVGPPLAQYNSLNEVHLDFNLTARATQPGDVNDVVYWDRNTSSWRTGTYKAVEGYSDAFRQKQKLFSEAGILQSYWLRDNLITTVGWRQDESTTHATTDFPRFASGDQSGSVDLGALALNPKPVDEVKGQIWTYSAVLKLPQRFRLPFGIRPSVHYSQSENFQPVSGQVNVFGGKLAPPTGRTKEYGFSFSALDQRFHFRANAYETSLLNARTGDITAANFFTVLGIDFQTAQYWYEGLNGGATNITQANIDRLITSIPQGVRDLVGYKVVTDPDGRKSPQYVYPSNVLADVTNFQAKGFEVESTLNLTSNWRVALNVAKQQSQKSDTAPFLAEYVALRTPIWQELGSIKRQPIGTGTATLFADANRAAISGVVATLRANDGIYSAELRKWRTNFITNYTFGRQSWLKGVGLGGAWRWQDKAALDYPRVVRADGIIVPDITRPFYAPSDSAIDLWVSYRRPLFGQRVKWKIQINVGNVFANNEFTAVTVHRDGTPAMVRLAPPRTWFLSSAFDF